MSKFKSKIPTLFEDHRAYLKQSDFPRAVETAVAIKEQTEPVDSLLADFRTAIREDDIELASTLLRQIERKFTEQKIEKQARVNRTLSALNEGELSKEERDSLIQFTRDIATTQLGQSNFLTSALTYLANPDTVDDSKAINSADTLESAERSLQRRQEEVQESIDKTDTGSIPSILRLDTPKKTVTGTEVSVTIVYGNVGQSKSGSLTLELSVEGGFEINETPNISALPADSQESITVEGEATASGEHTVTARLLEADSGEPLDSLSETVSVSDSTLSVRKAIGGPPERTPRTDEIQGAIELWADDERVAQTGGETVSTDVLQDVITEWLEQGEANE